jgi:hypothetical protein
MTPTCRYAQQAVEREPQLWQLSHAGNEAVAIR